MFSQFYCETFFSVAMTFENIIHIYVEDNKFSMFLTFFETRKKIIFNIKSKCYSHKSLKKFS
jgi:hypothetical protein